MTSCFHLKNIAFVNPRMSLFGAFNFVLQGSQQARLKPRRPFMANPVFTRYVLKLKIGRFPLRALRPLKPRRILKPRRPPLRAPRRSKPLRPPLRTPRRIKPPRPPLRAPRRIKPRRPPPRTLRRIKRALRRCIIRNIRIVFLLSYITWISLQPCTIRTVQSFVNTSN